LAAKIDGITDFAGQPVTAVNAFIRQHNESFQFQWISPNQLSSAELAIWKHTDQILEFVGGRPSRVTEIRISETMSSGSFSTGETMGLWDPANGWIILKRSLLQNLDEYAGTLLHEALHAKFALVDVSRDFEHYLTQLCGRLAAKAIQQSAQS
jgi:hypothetical protein